MTFSINGRLISPNTPPYIIAEIGINHNGSFKQAMKLVDAAAAAGVDAVKFQAYRTTKLLSLDSEYFELLKGFELKPSEYEALFERAKGRKIDAFAACFDEESADIWNDFGAPAFKIASGDITHHRLLKKIAKFNKPMIVSTGASSLNDIALALETIDVVNPNLETALLHCVSKYPTEPEEANLRCIKTLQENFGKIVGFSDHTEGVLTPLAAICVGALIIEKHFTLDKNGLGPDHKLSADPNEMSEIVSLSKRVFESLGDGKKELVEGVETQTAIRRSITLSKSLKANEVIDETMIEVTRPGHGIQSGKLSRVVGKRVRKDLERGHRLSPDDFIETV